MIKTMFSGCILVLMLLRISPISSQCTLACYSQLNVSLDLSGTATLAPSDVLAFVPTTCGPLVVSPNSFNCSDIGSPILVTVTEPSSGNSCFSSINVEDKFVPSIACLSSLTTALPMDGTLELFPADILAFSSDNCPLTYAITPDILSCPQVGLSTVVTLTASDPNGNTATCFTTVNIQATAMTMICEAQINISLPTSGTFGITPDLILLPPTPPSCALTVSTPIVDCSDLGNTIVVIVSDTLSGNSCFSSITIEDKIGPTIGCNASTNVQIGLGGNITLNPTDLLAFANDNCSSTLTYTLIPSVLDCSDVGNTVPVSITASDQGGNTAICFGDVNVIDTAPSSVSIVEPSSISCGSSGIVFNAAVIGGSGPFNYTWSIKGNPWGWSITSGQGTPTITMVAGTKKINLEVKVTDGCGNQVKKKTKVSCNSAFVYQPHDQQQRASLLHEGLYEVTIYPNPVNDQLFWKMSEERSRTSSPKHFRIVDLEGRVHLEGSALLKQINIESLPSGFYFFQLVDSISTHAKSFVKI